MYRGDLFCENVEWRRYGVDLEGVRNGHSNVFIELFADQVTQEEFKTLPTAAMDQYMNNIKETHPAHRERFSNQAWLLQGKFADDVLRRLRKR